MWYRVGRVGSFGLGKVPNSRAASAPVSQLICRHLLTIFGMRQWASNWPPSSPDNDSFPRTPWCNTRGVGPLSLPRKSFEMNYLRATARCSRRRVGKFMTLKASRFNTPPHLLAFPMINLKGLSPGRSRGQNRERKILSLSNNRSRDIELSQDAGDFRPFHALCPQLKRPASLHTCLLFPFF